MDQYKKEPIFHESFEEFEDSRETVQCLIDEYSNAEKDTYLEWGNNEDMDDNEWMSLRFEKKNL